eukprot:1427490-Rhodomonas_salina.1
MGLWSKLRSNFKLGLISSSLPTLGSSPENPPRTPSSLGSLGSARGGGASSPGPWGPGSGDGPRRVDSSHAKKRLLLSDALAQGSRRSLLQEVLVC